FSAADAAAVALRLYGVGAEALPLASERDQNFRLQTSAGDAFVLKIANAADDRRLLEAQHAALACVARRSTLCPAVVPALDGRLLVDVEAAGVTHVVRLLTWLPGLPLADAGAAPAEMLVDLGARLAELDAALEGFDDPAVHRDFYWDLTRAVDVIGE